MTTTFLSVARASALACLLFCQAVPLVQAQSLPLPSPSPGAGTPVPVVLDMSSLRRQLAAPAGAAARSGGSITHRISLPTLHGVQPFVLSETFVVPASDVAAHQRLRTFVGNVEGNNGAGQQVSLVLTPNELRADLLAGSESASLRPAANGPGYLLRAEQATTGPCGTLDGVGGALRPGDFATLPAPFSFGTQLRRVKKAILVTKEYYVANGNTDAAVELAVVATMNQMSGLFLREVSVSFELVKPTGGARYFSAVTTPTLPDSDPATPNRLRDGNTEDVRDIMNARFVASTFDLGHCFSSSGGGGTFVGIVCNNEMKTRAWSGVSTSGFQWVLAHEIGHQLGCFHAFAGPCGSNIDNSRLEPGGGASIMGYTYVCGDQSLQDVTGTEQDHFNLQSLNQMRNNLVANTCPTLTPNANRPPTLNAGPDYTIPRNTPFTLTATGSDPDGEALAYTWNQFDYSPTNIGALGSIVGAGGLAAVDDPNAPLFRPRAPRTTLSRTFPDLRYVLANANRPVDRIGEALPNVGRDIHFVVTARDQRPAGGTFTTDNVTLTVAPNTGPFALTSQNTAATTAPWVGGQPATITWSVNGTNQAPINVSQVRISLSTDGGLTFGTVLAPTLPNSGTASITVPNVTTSQARVRVEAVGNIFFDINDVDFSIAASPAPAITSFTPASGPVGTVVTLTGTNLSGTTAVRFNTTAAASFSLVAATSVTATVGAGTGSGLITVTTPAGTGTSATPFTVLAPPVVTALSPASGRVGTVVTVTGTALSGAMRLTLNGVVVPGFSVVNATSVTFTVPAGATSGPVVVTTAGGVSNATQRFTVTVVSATVDTTATVFSVWPNPVGAQAALHVRLAGPASAARVTLRNALGQLVRTRTFAGSATELPTAGLASGLYLLRVQADGYAPTVRRVVVE